jgi:hypothetical protein
VSPPGDKADQSSAPAVYRDRQQAQASRRSGRQGDDCRAVGAVGGGLQIEVPGAGRRSQDKPQQGSQDRNQPGGQDHQDPVRLAGHAAIIPDW